MPVESAGDLAGMFADFAEGGTLTLGALGGQVVQVRAIMDRPEERLTGGRLVQPAAQARIRASSLPTRPRAGDVLTLAAPLGTFKVASCDADATGAVLLLTLTR